MSRPIATTVSMDSGGKGDCNSPPLVTGAASSGSSISVYAMKKPVLFNSNVLAPAPGTTPKGDPCTNPRKVVAISNSKTSKNGIAKVGDVLNEPRSITIASTPDATVYVV
jgi:hypothetical protein